MILQDLTYRCRLLAFNVAERTGFEPDSAIYLRVKYFLFYLLWQVTIWKLSVHFLSEPVSKNLYYSANINILFYLHKFSYFFVYKSLRLAVVWWFVSYLSRQKNILLIGLRLIVIRVFVIALVILDLRQGAYRYIYTYMPPVITKTNTKTQLS